MSAQAFVDPFQNPYDDVNGWYLKNSDSIGNRLGDFLGYYNTKSENEVRMAKLNAAYERASVSSARAWDEYMDSTHYQRLVKDLEAAGLNPWLALQSGIGGSGSTNTASQGGTAKIKNSKEDTASGIFGFLLSAAKLIAMLVK